MSTSTTNYNFIKPEGTDFYNIEDQNGNWDIADSTIKSVDDNAKAHKEDDVESSGGAHGLRYQSDTLEAYNTTTHEWDKIQTGGGSLINVTTEDTEFYGLTVTLTDGTSTMTGTFDNNGLCQFSGVTMNGTLTVSVSYDGDTFTNTVAVTYYGTYNVTLSIGEVFTLNVSTTETTLYGQTITVTNGTKTKTGQFNNSGTATITIYFSGNVTVSATDGTDTADKTITVTSGTSSYLVSLAFVHIYGVEWDGSSTQAWTRTDDAADFIDPTPAVNNGNGSSPFDDLYPWSDMTIVEDAEAGTLVKIPKFWYKLTQTGSAIKLQIANKATDGFSVCPACADRGDGKGERDYMYVGRYHCASTYKSATGVNPLTNATRATFRSNIHALGNNIWQYDISTHITIWFLYLVEYANWDTQKTIGYGCAPIGISSVRATGYTDSIIYHTGTDAATRTTYGSTQYRHIEGLWDNCYDWCDGIYFTGSTGIRLIKNPANFSDSSNGSYVGDRATGSGYIKSMKVSSAFGFDWFMYPDNTSGATEDTYVGDYCSYGASAVVLYVGGDYTQSRNHGLFFFNWNVISSSASTIIGSRLIKLP